MNYSQLLEAALAELNQANADQSRRDVFRKIATRQQLDTIAIALHAGSANAFTTRN
jgi:tRNA(Ile)-lysidine synthase TilS/MesJ